MRSAAPSVGINLISPGFIKAHPPLPPVNAYPMLYIRAKTQRYYLHIEGMMKTGHVRWYAKLTQSIRNKHAHKDEIIGWDNLYHERPHVHFDEDQRREYHTQPLTWNDIRETLARLEATS
jgi:hypothetical protein